MAFALRLAALPTYTYALLDYVPQEFRASACQPGCTLVVTYFGYECDCRLAVKPVDVDSEEEDTVSATISAATPTAATAYGGVQPSYRSSQVTPLYWAN